MFDRLDMSPRRFARMQKLECGAKVPNPDKPMVHPTEFGPDRAQEIADAAHAATTCGPWVDQIEDQMTDGELVFVLVIWDRLSGSSCWMDAFNRIWRGEVQAMRDSERAAPAAYAAAMAKLD